MALLAQLYNYGVVDGRTVFDTLYLLLTLGHEDAARVAALDPLTDCFRIRCVHNKVWSLWSQNNLLFVQSWCAHSKSQFFVGILTRGLENIFHTNTHLQVSYIYTY